MRPLAESGFTLLEMLVALSVLSLAVLALINLASENARSAGLIEERLFAGIVAENRAVEALTSLQPPALGQTSGSEKSADRDWRWARTVRATPQQDIVRIDVTVKQGDDEQVLGEVTVFRGLK